ncbi:hypothetical protein CEXT_513761 [Caerostris extrusa]|uniref:Uncharacterized protein n=1 Tax=Caerostris extrusa TaxID=172846 RepID=A0AAV4NR25_CAEEX|nr:hypothetical protein CEXT_513761 [Caerostris extrusa]
MFAIQSARLNRVEKGVENNTNSVGDHAGRLRRLICQTLVGNNVFYLAHFRNEKYQGTHFDPKNECFHLERANYDGFDGQSFVVGWTSRASNSNEF